MPLIELTNLWKVYRSESRGRMLEVQALRGLNLQVAAGDYLAIMGPSGGGKSTLLHQIGLLDSPTFGSYILGGREVGSIPEEERARLRNTAIGFVFQNSFLLPRLTVLRNTELPLTYRLMSAAERRQRAEAALAAVGLRERLLHYPMELSGGEQQRAAIARALVQETPLILADEPTGNLDSATGQTILSSFELLHSRGTTLIVVTHDPEVASRAQKTVHMLDGRIV